MGQGIPAGASRSGGGFIVERHIVANRERVPFDDEGFRVCWHVRQNRVGARDVFEHSMIAAGDGDGPGGRSGRGREGGNGLTTGCGFDRGSQKLWCWL